jgi:hypothetical protein
VSPARHVALKSVTPVATGNENAMTITDVDARFFHHFSETFLSDDLEGFMELIDDECVWEIMATGEVFAGAAKVRELAERSVAGRTHTADVHMAFVDHFNTNDRMCLEYVHEAIVTDKWPASKNRPAVGTRVKVPICLVCRLKNEKFVHIDEYFDLGTAIAGSRNARLYS